MRNDFHLWGREQWYSVDAYDLQGARVELKVSPKTRKVFSWIIRSEKNQKREERKRQEDEIAVMSESTAKTPQELVCP